ncbi:MAG: type II toxin-antitoxin system VapC family toxin [Nitrospirae bacterium]|nr:type II toxin-antitoxin system VapC family toxin [Nitrospirota bacterium]
MAELVPDSSVVSAFMLREEQWENIAAKIGAARWVVPGPLLRFEVCNAIRKRRSTPAEVQIELMREVWSAPALELPTDSWLPTALDLSVRHGTSFTDSCFIAVASVRNLPLWTLDQRQADAARAAGVSVELS